MGRKIWQVFFGFKWEEVRLFLGIKNNLKICATAMADFLCVILLPLCQGIFWGVIFGPGNFLGNVRRLRDFFGS